jgi:hypothetical protein
MTTRDQLYQAFGPKLIEVIVDIVMDEINILRSKANLAPRTKQQLVDALKTRLDDTTDYDWMNRQP